MRQQSRKKVQVRGRSIGGEQPLVCLPLVAEDEAGIMSQAEALTLLNPDLIEWRVDGYKGLDNPASCLEVLGRLREAIGGVPLIYTLRIDQEGGMQSMDQGARKDIIIAAIQSGNIDLVDIELCNEQEFITDVRAAAKTAGVALILSYHNFTSTPDETFICHKLYSGWETGADIPKLAVMPNSPADVLTLLNATNRVRSSGVDTPLITIAMGPLGAVTRLAGGLFGADITFAVGTASSAPGQIPISDLRQAMELLYPKA